MSSPSAASKPSTLCWIARPSFSFLRTEMRFRSVWDLDHVFGERPVTEKSRSVVKPRRKVAQIGDVRCSRNHRAEIESEQSNVENDLFASDSFEVDPVVVVRILSLPEHVAIEVSELVLTFDLEGTFGDTKV